VLVASQRILIVAHSHRGHRLVYVHLLADTALARGEHVTLALTPAGFKSDEFKAHLEQVAHDCELVNLQPGQIKPRGVAKLANDAASAKIIVPDGDRFAMRLALTLYRPHASVTALVTQDPRWATSRRPDRRLKMWVKRAMLYQCARRRHVRVVYLTGQSPVGHLGRLVAPDPVLFDGSHLDRNELREQLGLRRDLFWFIVAGGITPRKNLPLVMDALSAAHLPPSGLFVAGPIDASVLHAIGPLVLRAKRAGITVVINNRIHTDGEIDRAIKASDCVVVAYSTDSPNSMTTKSSLAGRRVIVAGSPILCSWARNLGITMVGPLHCDSLIELMHRAVATPEPSPTQGIGSRPFVEALL
jgi:hypothetical protein